MKSRFIVFEGIDGAGKGTIVSGVKKLLLEQGVSEEKILVTAEPTNGAYGLKVRQLLKNSSSPESNAHLFLELYVKDREQHLDEEIIPALKQEKIVLCDRFKYSTFVYQLLQGIPLEKIKKLHSNFIVPDLVFVLDVSAEISLKRINIDSKREGLDSFERKDFLEKVREGFLSLKEIFPNENIIIIDSSRKINQIQKEVFEIIWNSIKKK